MATATLIQVFKTQPYLSSGGNAKGDIVATNDRIGVCVKAIAAGATGDLAIDYIADMPKDGGSVNDGARVNWVSSTVTATLTTGVPLGITTQSQLSGDSTARVAVSSLTNAIAKQAAVVAALVDSTGGTNAATLAAITLPTALTDSSGGTASATLAAVASTFSQTVLANAFASLAARQAENRAAINLLTNDVSSLTTLAAAILTSVKANGSMASS